MELALATLDSPPTWVNRAGRIDRSACVELRASEIWPHTELQPARLFAKPGTRRPQARVTRQAAGSLVITADWLLALHDRRLPRRLTGDYRTGKANAMRYFLPSGQRLIARRRLSSRNHPGATADTRFPELSGPDANLPPNPNRGASRHKTLGLPADWQQEISVERWRLHAKLAQHFLLCPRCQLKTLKLFLPLCSAQEESDARIAALWLKTNFANQPYSELALRVINRYGVLFPPRRLLCRPCLGLRYGEVKPEASSRRSPLLSHWTPPAGTAARLGKLVVHDQAQAALGKVRGKFRRAAKLRRQIDDLDSLP